MSERKTYKVIQWATGNVGSRSLRRIIEHPRMELVGLWVSSEAKDGKDAGELAGIGPVGIKATRSVDDLIATEADCVVYMRQGTDIDELCRILASGKNVVTTRGDFHNPAFMAADTRAKIEAACAHGGTSIYSTGSSPGFSTEALASTLLLMSRRLDCLTIDEFADMESRDSPEMIFNIMGYGAPMESFDSARAEYVKHDFAGSLSVLADAMGIPAEEWVAFGEASAAKNDVQIAAGTIPKGTIAAQRITIEGRRGGKPFLRMRLNWYASRDIEHTDWELRESGWRIQIEGDTPLDVHITFPVAPEDYAEFTPGLTSHPAVNAVLPVCDAPPGIRTTADLPRVMPQFG